MEKELNQTSKLVDYFTTVEPKISQLVAGKVLGIDRLASRIFDLREMGADISKTTKRDWTGKRYTEYVFEGWS